MGYAVFGIIVVTASFLAFLSWSSWRIPNIVLVFLIACAAAVFGYMAAYTLKVHSAWRTVAAKQEIEIAKEKAKVEEQDFGKLDAESGELRNGIRQLTQEVHDLVVHRGPAWFDVQARKPNAKGVVEVIVESPEPHGMVENSVVYAFEAGTVSDGAKYVGEFVVSKAAADSKNVVLTPNLQLTDAELKRLQGLKSDTWTIYQKMPTDENEVFAALTKEQAAAILPDDVPDDVRSGTRKIEDMHDYVYQFHQYALQRGLLQDAMAKIESNISRLIESEKRNQAKIEYREQEKTNLQSDKATFNGELATVKQYRGGLEAKLARLTKDVEAIKANNLKLAAQLKELELKAAAAINRQTDTAQATPAGVAP